MLGWVSILVVAVIVGHGVRRAAPYLVGLADRSPPFRGPWWELFSIAVFAWLYEILGISLATGKWYLFASLLLAVTASDLQSKLIPDRVTFAGAILGVLSSALWPTDIASFFHHAALIQWFGIDNANVAGLVLGLCGAATGFLALEVFRRAFGLVAGLEVMGMGDSKLLMLTGAFLGPEMVLFSVVPGVFCGLLFGTLYTWIAKTPHFPFGPALGVGALVSLLHSASVLSFIRRASGWFLSMGSSIHIGFMLLLSVIMVWLVLRIRKRASRYSRMIEEDYARLERKP